MKENNYKKDIRYAKDNLKKILPYIFTGICLGLVLCYCLISEFYFYQAVVATILIAPLIIFFFICSSRHCLLGLLVLTIPFNPSINIIRNEPSAPLWVGLTFSTTDLIVIFILIYLLICNAVVKIRRHSRDTSLWYLGLPLLFWIAAGMISIIPAVNKSIAIIELIRMFRILLIFLAVFYLVERVEDLRFICVCLVIAFAIQIFLVFMEYWVGHSLFRLPGEVREADIAGEILRPRGSMGHSSHFAKLATLCLPICFAFIYAMRKIWRLVFGIALIGGFSALVLTVSRAGIVTSLFGLCLMFITMLQTKLRQKKIIILVTLTLLIISMISAWNLGIVRLLSRMAEDYSSAISRPQMFVVAWNVIKEHPIFGVGLNNYTLIAPLYDQTKNAISITFPHPVHNIYLLYAAEMGIPGLVFFLWFLVATIFSSFKHSSNTRFLIDSALMKAIGVGITCSWLQGLIGWGFRSSIVHTSYLAVFAGALAAQSYYKQHRILANHNA